MHAYKYTLYTYTYKRSIHHHPDEEKNFYKTPLLIKMARGKSQEEY
jgi:hypothetical protein